MPLRRKNKQVQLLNMKPKETLYVSHPSSPAATRSQSLDDLTDDNIDASRAEISKTPPPPPRGGRLPSESPSSPRHNIQIIPLMKPRQTPRPETSPSPGRDRSLSSPEKPVSKALKQTRPISICISDRSAEHSPTPSRTDYSRSPSPSRNIQIIAMMEPKRHAERSLSPSHAHPLLAKTKSAPQPDGRSSADFKDAKTKQRSNVDTETKIHSELRPPKSAVSITFNDD